MGGRALPCSLLLLLAACSGGVAPTNAIPHPAATSRGIYVANVRGANVVRLNASGKVQLVLQGGIAPSGVGVTSGGDVAISGNQQNVVFFHPGQTTPFRSFTDSGLGATAGIAFDKNDDAFVFDRIYSAFDVYDPAANGAVSPMAALRIIATADGNVTAFDVNEAGVLYVLTDKPQILGYVYDAGARTFTKTPAIAGSADFPDAGGVTALPNGDVLVTNANREMLEYDSNGSPVNARPVQGLCTVTWLRNITWSGSGYAFASNFCGSNGPSISAYAVDGAPQPAPGPTPNFTITGAAAQLGASRETAIAFDRSGGAMNGTLYVSNPPADTVTGYCFAACFGANYPSLQISLGYPVMNGVQAVYFSKGLMYTTDSATPAISIFALPSSTQSGTAYPAPLARILTAPGGLCGASYTVVDPQGNLLVSEGCKTTANFIAKLTVPSNPHGDTIAPFAAFAGTPGPCSGSIMCNPQQMAFDERGNLYVTDYGDDTHQGSVELFSPSGTLLSQMTGADIRHPSGVAIDPQGNVAVLSNGTNPYHEIAFFTPPASGVVNAVPVRVIGVAANVDVPTNFPQIAIDRDGTVYVDLFKDILAYPPGSSGSAAPVVFNDPSLTGGTGLAIAP